MNPRFVKPRPSKNFLIFLVSDLNVLVLDLLLINLDQPVAVLVLTELRANRTRHDHLQAATSGSCVDEPTARVPMIMSAEDFAHAGSAEPLEQSAPLHRLNVEVGVGGLVGARQEQGNMLEHDQVLPLGIIALARRRRRQLSVQPLVLLLSELGRSATVEIELRVERHEFTARRPEAEVVVAELVSVGLDALRARLVAHVVIAAHADQLDLGAQLGQHSLQVRHLGCSQLRPGGKCVDQIAAATQKREPNRKLGEIY